MEAAKETKFGTGDEDDAQTLNTCIAQRKCVIPHSTMKMHHNIIECVVITLTRGRHIPATPAEVDLGDDQSRYLYTRPFSNT